VAINASTRENIADVFGLRPFKVIDGGTLEKLVSSVNSRKITIS